MKRAHPKQFSIITRSEDRRRKNILHTLFTLAYNTITPRLEYKQVDDIFFLSTSKNDWRLFYP